MLHVRDTIVGALGGAALRHDRITDDVVVKDGNGQLDVVDPATPGAVVDGVIPFCRARLGAAGHEVGTLRLGNDAEESVVDANLQVRGCPQLYVCDLSVFPTSPAANPSLTLGALAIRLADHLRAELGVPEAASGGGGGR